jgi:hypothetical protein
MIIQDLFEEQQSCPHCGGPMFSEMLMMEKKDACYYKVKASAKVWPSAYASGRLVQCRKKGAGNYGNKSESMAEGSVTPDVNVSKVHDDGHEKEWHIYRGKEMIGYVIKNQPDTAEGLYIAYGHGPGRAFVEEFTGLKPAVNYIASLKEGVAEEFELAGVDVAYELGRRAYKERKTARDNPYSATREARKYDEWAKGLERGKHDANAARHFRGSVREQGMAEAGDSNFVGFMNKTLADKVDSPKADPIAGAPDFYRNAAVSTLDGRQGFKNALKFGLKALSRLDPETRQQLAAGSEQAVANYLTDVAERSGQMGDNTFVEEDITEVQDYLGDVFHDPSINSWKDVLQQSQGMSDGQLDEKSVSQAQFRTMAAAAHNPKFAKKVGIKQSVAKEFNQADKGGNYKKLPDRTTEGAPVTTTPGSINPGGAVDNFKQQMANNTEVAYKKKLSGVGEGEQQKGADYRDPPEADYGDDYQDMVARMKKLAGLGPLKTVYDPAKRVYRNMPTAVQPKK